MESYVNLEQALIFARDGHFVTNIHFDCEESLHFWNGKYFYEDGAIVSREFLESQEFASGDSWFVKYAKEKVNNEKLNDMHKRNTGYMLSEGSYEDCIIKD